MKVVRFGSLYPSNFSFDKNYGYIKEIKSGLNQYFEEDLIMSAEPMAAAIKDHPEYQIPIKNKLTLSQYFERELLEETSSSERNRDDSVLIYNDSELLEHEDDDEEIDIYTSYASYMSSSDPGSDNILVTIDYGSMDDDLSIDSLGIVEEEPEPEEPEEIGKHMQYLEVPSPLTRMSKVKLEQSKESLQKSSDSLLRRVLNPFQVHRMQHSDTTRSNSVVSSMNSLREYNVDTSGDYGSWQQQSESECGDRGTPREYRYEDLIKDEMMDDNNNGDDYTYEYDNEDNGVDGFVNECRNEEDDEDDLVDFNYDVALSARWSSENDKLYYRSVDFLN